MNAETTIKRLGLGMPVTMLTPREHTEAAKLLVKLIEAGATHYADSPQPLAQLLDNLKRPGQGDDDEAEQEAERRAEQAMDDAYGGFSD